MKSFIISLCMMIMPVCVVMANEKPQVRMVVSSTAGSLPDVLSRPVTKYLQSQGYEVITDYRPGAGNSIGTRYFVNIKPEKNQVVLLAGNATVALHEFFQQPPARLANLVAALKREWQAAHDAALGRGCCMPHAPLGGGGGHPFLQ